MDDKPGPKREITVTITEGEYLYLRNGLAALLNSGHPEGANAEIRALDDKLKVAAADHD